MITFAGLWQQLRQHSRRLWLGQWLALCGAAVAVPIPLLMPLLVDEVLLHQPGKLTRLMTTLLPSAWLGPVAIIICVTLFTITLRLSSVLLGVATTRIFVNLSKQVTLNVRQALLDKLARIRMQVYESLGAGQVTARLLTDIETLDKFLGETIAKVLVAVLSASLSGLSIRLPRCTRSSWTGLLRLHLTTCALHNQDIAVSPSCHA